MCTASGTSASNVVVLLAVAKFATSTALGGWSCGRRHAWHTQSDRLHTPRTVRCNHGEASRRLVQGVNTIPVEPVELEVVARGRARRLVCIEVAEWHVRRLDFFVIDAFKLLVHLDLAPRLV